MTRSDTAGVIAPPPAIVLALIALGVGLGRLWPLPVGVRAQMPWAGPVTLAGAVALAAWTLAAFARAGTSPRPDRPSTAIVTDGPFTFSRNPAYLSALLGMLGVALWMDNVWGLVVAAPAFALLHVGVVLREERYLERKFGDTYSTYRRSVRRWI